MSPSSSGAGVRLSLLEGDCVGPTRPILASCEPWGSAFQKLDIRTCQDVYEWEAKGTGSCKSESQNGGCLYLLSTGKGAEPAFFADADEDGENVFIFTANPLVSQDKDALIDAYDVRVGGGLASQNQPATKPCDGEACKPEPDACAAPPRHLAAPSFSRVRSTPSPSAITTKKRHRKHHKQHRHAKTTRREGR